MHRRRQAAACVQHGADALLRSPTADRHCDGWEAAGQSDAGGRAQWAANAGRGKARSEINYERGLRTQLSGVGDSYGQRRLEAIRRGPGSAGMPRSEGRDVSSQSAPWRCSVWEGRATAPVHSSSLTPRPRSNPMGFVRGALLVRCRRPGCTCFPWNRRLFPNARMALRIPESVLHQPHINPPDSLADTPSTHWARCRRYRFVHSKSCPNTYLQIDISHYANEARARILPPARA